MVDQVDGVDQLQAPPYRWFEVGAGEGGTAVAFIFFFDFDGIGHMRVTFTSPTWGTLLAKRGAAQIRSPVSQNYRLNRL